VTFITYRIFPATDEKDAMGLDQSKMGSVVAKQMEAL
jgi:hypothetical protein